MSWLHCAFFVKATPKNALPRPRPPQPILRVNCKGGTPASQPPASAEDTIPEELIAAVSRAVELGCVYERGRMVEFEKKSYPAAAVLAVIKKRAGGEAGGGSTAGRRKSKHCVPRLCEVVALEGNRQSWAGHRTQLSRAELDAKVTGKTRHTVIDVWNQFKDDGVKVRYGRVRPVPHSFCTACSSIFFPVVLLSVSFVKAKGAVVAIVGLGIMVLARHGPASRERSCTRRNCSSLCTNVGVLGFGRHS